MLIIILSFRPVCLCHSVQLIIMSAFGVQPPNRAGGAFYSSEETELKVELTEQLFAQGTDNEVSLLHFGTRL